MSRAPLHAAPAVDDALEGLLALMETMLSLASQMIEFGATNLPLERAMNRCPEIMLQTEPIKRKEPSHAVHGR